MTGSDTAVIDVSVVAPAVTMDKTVYAGHDSGAGCDGGELVNGEDGDPVTYCFRVENTGDTNLAPATIDDADIGIDQSDMTVLSGSLANMAPGDVAILFYEGSITGDLTNTATATGDPAASDGTDLPGLSDVTDTDTADVAEYSAEVTVDKTVYFGHDSGASCAGVETVYVLTGEPVTYCFRVQNTGDTNLSPATVDDADLGIDQGDMSVLSGSLSNMAPGDVAVLYFEETATGDLVNTASASGNPADSSGTDLAGLSDVSVTDTAAVDVVAPSIDVQKTVYAGHDSGAGCMSGELVNGVNGDLVTYCFRVENTGDTNLSPATIDDADLGIDQGDMSVLSGSLSNMAPGDVAVLFYEGSITGDLVNTASASGNPAASDGTDLAGLSNVSDSDTAEVAEYAPQVDVQKTVYAGHDSGAGCAGVETVYVTSGSDVTYCFRVENTGDTNLTPATVDDADLGIDQGDMSVLSGSLSNMAPGDVAVLYFDGTATGDLINTASATGDPADGSATDLSGLSNVTDTDSAAVDVVAPSIDVQKTVYAGHDSGAGCAGGELVSGVNGDPVTYCFRVENTGDTYLDATVNDPDIGIDQTDMTVLSGSLTGMAPRSGRLPVLRRQHHR